jgi:hypothetical protein
MESTADFPSCSICGCEINYRLGEYARWFCQPPAAPVGPMCKKCDEARSLEEFRQSLLSGRKHGIGEPTIVIHRHMLRPL